MSRRVVILVTSRTIQAAHLVRRQKKWTIAGRSRVPCEAPHTIDEFADLTGLAEPMAQAARRCVAGDPEIDLVIPAGWCFVHALETAARKVTDQSASFAFEEFVPAPISDLTMTWMSIDPERVLAVAVATAPMLRLLDALTERGVEVRRIRVDGLLARSSAGEGAPGVILRDGQRFTSAVRDSIRTVLYVDDAFDAHRSISAAIAGIDPANWRTLELDGDSDPAAQVATPSASGIEGLLVAAAETASPDLRTGGLASHHRHAAMIRHATRCAALAIVLLCALVLRDLLASRQLKADLDRINAAQTRVFKEVFPERVLPAAPALVLASERKRLAALTQTRASGQDDSDPGGQRAELLEDLTRFATGLPDDLRIRVAEVSIDGQQISLRGRTTDHREAERIADALRRVPGVDCGLPRTSRLPDGGVEFSIRGKRTAARAEDHIASGDAP